MSAFGYGSSYMPSWREASQPQQTSAAFQIAPAAAAPNWAPQADQAWADPTDRQVGYWNYSRNGGGTKVDETGGYWHRDAWGNPLDSLLGSMDAQNGYSKNNAIGGQDLYRTPVAGYAHSDGYGRSLDPGQDRFGNVEVPMSQQFGWDYTNNQVMKNKDGSTYHQRPLDAKELYNSIGSLSLDQLMRLGSGGLSLADKFSNTAKQYANAYANSNYGSGKLVTDQQPGLANTNPLNQQETTDWLQKSYDSAFKRMNDAYLL